MDFPDEGLLLVWAVLTPALMPHLGALGDSDDPRHPVLEGPRYVEDGLPFSGLDLPFRHGDLLVLEFRDYLRHRVAHPKTRQASPFFDL